MKIRPPAVTNGPPSFSVPVGGMPRAFNFGYSPNGTFHLISPVFRSTAFTVPQGALMAGSPSASNHRANPDNAYGGAVIADASAASAASVPAAAGSSTPST